MLLSLIFKQYDLHVVLTSDIELLHTVTGLQTCSSKNPCLMCLIQLEDLRKFRSIGVGEERTAQNFAAHLTTVLQASSWSQRKNLHHCMVPLLIIH